MLRDTVWPLNFGLSDRSGTDAAIHLLRYITDNDPTNTVLNIGGAGAFDHVCKTRMFEELLRRIRPEGEYSRAGAPGLDPF